jgi:hypothetical protein
VRLAVYDLAGRVVWSDEGGTVEAGRTWLHWPGDDRRGLPASTGVYLARVTVDGEVFVRRFTLMR